MKEEKVEFCNNKKQKIVGLLSLPEKKNSPIVIAIHGFKGAKEYYPFLNNSIKPLTDEGIAVLRIDCRGTGESDFEFKDFTIKTEAEDVLMAIDYVKGLKGIDSERIALIGISMGAAAVLLAMEKKPKVKTLVFWGPGWYFKDGSRYDTPEARRTVKEQGVFYVTQGFTGKKLIAGGELLQEMSTLDVRPFMKFVKIPVLILRGLRDQIVRVVNDKEAVKILKAEYKTIKKGDHNFTDKESERELIKLTVDWFNKWLK